jgi:crotonobetainyl-CoA:carnitine CoA-transferase CaiB-like acyl-CoA transferase
VKPIYHSDATGALTLLFAALTGLRQRDATGEGCYIDLSQIEALVWQLPGLLAEWTLNRRLPERLGNTDPYAVPHDAYPAAGDDSWVFVAAETDEQWAGLAHALGHPEWAADGHAWASIPGRLRARAEIDAAVAAFTSARTSFEAADAIEEADAIAAPVISAPELLASQQLLARDWIRTVEHQYSGTRLFPGFIWDVRPDPITWDRPSGLVGEHNAEVLGELGYSETEIEGLRQGGVIGAGYGPWDPRTAAPQA